MLLSINMVQPFLNEDIGYYWLISVGAIFSFVGLIVACICSCRRNDNKSEFLGLAGMVTITHPDNEGFNRITTIDSGQALSQDSVDGAGKRSNTANRSLPDIPKDKNVDCGTEAELRDIYENTEHIGGDLSELYATVQDKNKESKDKRNEQSLSQQSSQDETASLYARLHTPQTSSEEHPYAQLQNISKTENIQLNGSSHLVDVIQPSTSSEGVPVAPPRSRRSSSHNSLLEQPTISEIQAATAITGGVQANQDLPYMTPPILMPLPQPPLSVNNNLLQQHFSGDSQDSKGYTSISVREPLANIIAQTKNAQQLRQTSQPILDSHYATVSDDSDEMYAAIDDQDKVYTSGSETYAQIQPMTVEQNRPVSNEQSNVHLPSTSRVEESYALAPQPPSVDSLRHVAHAHSRQASSSSATSSIVNPGSPKPEKRQANSPLPPPPENPLEMYAVIDKRNKGDFRGKSLEDMYAKVMKKKRDSSGEELTTSPTSALKNFSFEVASSSLIGIPSTSREPPPSVRRKLSLIESNRTSWTNHDSNEILKRESDIKFAVQEQKPLKINGEPAKDEVVFDPEYDTVINTMNVSANYETLRPLPVEIKSASRNGTDVLPIYAMPFKRRQVSSASSDDPGYERVRLRKNEDLDMDSEPNYESMPHEITEPNYASVACRLGGESDIDPNYESVNNCDPNYESVKYMSLSRKSEPPYERINFKDHNDPEYEKILRIGDPITNNIDTDDEQYVQV